MFHDSFSVFTESGVNDNAATENVLVRALKHVLDDDSFKINTPSTIQARKSAESLLDWCLKNNMDDRFIDFTRQFTSSLKQVICSSATKVFTVNKEKLWKGFYQLRVSQDFVKQWTDFTADADEPVKPVLFQHLSDLIFRMLIEQHFKIVHLDQEEFSELTENESGALRYVAGYICRHLRKKIQRSRGDAKSKEEMMICLMQLVRNKETEEHGTDEEWTNLMDRGGLFHVKEITFQLFRAIEYQVRDGLKGLKRQSQQSKSELIKKVTGDDDVQFIWLMATAEFDIEDRDIHEALLQKIVELFVTVRGFSVASAWLEKFKQQIKKPTKRTKSLHREVHDAAH